MKAFLNINDKNEVIVDLDKCLFIRRSENMINFYYERSNCIIEYDNQELAKAALMKIFSLIGDDY